MNELPPWANKRMICRKQWERAVSELTLPLKTYIIKWIVGAIEEWDSVIAERK